MCSVATDSLTSLEFNPISCAAMLCHFGQTRSCYVAILFILLGSTVTSIATGEYVTDPERFGQNEESASRNKERTGKRLVLISKVNLTDELILQTCSHDFLPCFLYLILSDIEEYYKFILLDKIFIFCFY